MKTPAPKDQKCPHCDGLHLGSRFDDCPYVDLANDMTATEEQRENAREWLRLKKAERATC